MHRFSLLFALSLLLILTGCAPSGKEPSPASLLTPFQSVPSDKCQLLQKGSHRDSCAVCGMHLPTYCKTNHAAVTKEKNARQYCSLHCLVYDNEIERTDLYDVKVVDTVSLRFIPAQSAFYVVGSRMPGTMTRFSKYAFAKRADADAFVRQYEGHVMNFYDAYTVAMEDFMEEEEK